MHEGLFEQLDTQTLRANVVDVVRRAILSSEYPPGMPINQTEIARELGISRGPLREALTQLQEEGLVRMPSYKSAYVADLSEQDVEEIYSLRCAFETFAVRRAAGRVPPVEMARLMAVVEQMRAETETRNPAVLGKLDLAFHRTLCELAHHSLLMQQWKGIENRVQRCLSARHRMGSMNIMWETHAAIAAAIQSGDGSHAVALLETHILSASAHLRGVAFEPLG